MVTKLDLIREGGERQPLLPGRKLKNAVYHSTATYSSYMLKDGAFLDHQIINSDVNCDRDGKSCDLMFLSIHIDVQVNNGYTM